MDLWALTDYAVLQLLAAAGAYAAGSNELNLWSVTGYPYRTQLEANGFVAHGVGTQPIIARALTGENMPFPAGAASFMYGDGDGYYDISSRLVVTRSSMAWTDWRLGQAIRTRIFMPLNCRVCVG